MFEQLCARVQKMSRERNALSKIAMRSREKGDLFAVCAMELAGAGSVIQLFPAGAFRSLDGRPDYAPAWILDETAVRGIIADIEARASPVVIDYEHQLMIAKKKGGPAPASGWFKRLEWRPGVGLFATDVEWTARAKSMIEAGEYRFISPVFNTDKRGRITKLFHAALTNDPAIDGMDPVMAHYNQEEPMIPKEILQALGLAEDAGDDAVLQAVADLKQQADGSSTQMKPSNSKSKL